jgi:hypothetical protein
MWSPAVVRYLEARGLRAMAAGFLLCAAREHLHPQWNAFEE